MADWKRPEVLAPAGDFERLTAAVRYGADAIYLGGKDFGMRASPVNFTEEELVHAVDFCHRKGVKVYVTCNILPRDEDLSALPGYLHFLQDAGVDALIVADIGVMMLCRREIPQMELHMSTQTGVVNHLTASELYKSLVVLGITKYAPFLSLFSLIKIGCLNLSLISNISLKFSILSN